MASYFKPTGSPWRRKDTVREEVGSKIAKDCIF